MFGARLILESAIGSDRLLEIQNEVDAIFNREIPLAANRLLDKYEDDREYVASVDGRPVSGRGQFGQALKSIEISFTQASLQLAVRVMEKLLENSIESYAASPEDDWVRKGEVRGSVTVFYGGKGRPIRLVNLSEIENFRPGDVVLLMPTYPTQLYANAKKFGSTGYMGKAAAKIRRAIHVTKRSSPLRVSAERSRAAFYEMTKQQLTRRTATGTAPFNITIPKIGMDSAWVIAIRYRTNRQR